MDIILRATSHMVIMSKNDPFLAENKNALIMDNLLQRRIQLVNPIGAKNGKYKLTAVYYVIGNLPPKYRSQLRLTHLAILVKKNHLKSNYNDFSQLLKPLIADLIMLQTERVEIHKQTVKGKFVSLQTT